MILVRWALRLMMVGALLVTVLPRPAMPAPLPLPDPAAAEALSPPVRGALTQVYGCTELAFEPPAPACPGGHFHAGIDIGAPAGTAVVAPAAAYVVAVAFDEAGYGRFVDLAHAGGITTRYAHLELALVEPGMRIGRGFVIGLVGSTGNSTGPHLHFELRDHGRLADPLAYLAADPTDGGFGWLTR